MSKQRYALSFFSLIALIGLFSCEQKEKDEWTVLFDGQSMDGWKANESPSTWKLEDGALVANGPRSHLFYVGDDGKQSFTNFEFIAEVKTEANSNSGIYFHTQYQNEGWPEKGYECQIYNTVLPANPDGYVERKMTGSLYAIRNLNKPPAKDGEWFTYRIVVQGKTIRTYINDQLMVDYTEPENPFRPEDKRDRLISSGTFALQGHDPGSTVYFKNIKVKRLPDDVETPGKPLEDEAFAKRIIQYSNDNIPLMDLHVHLKGDLTMEEALEHSRKYGFTYGVAFNSGLHMGFESDDSLQNFVSNYQQPPQTYFAMQAEGREWVELFEPETYHQFDYVFTDGMTWTNDDGKRMRLWIEEETEVGDPQAFMDQLVNRIEKIVTTEPIDIYVNATYLPGEIADRYDELWTVERMDKVVKALAEGGVAMEISARYQIPSARFIKKAKEAGVKFTFGTNNTREDDLGRLEYCMDMVDECGLQTSDFWFPNVEGQAAE